MRLRNSTIDFILKSFEETHLEQGVYSSLLNAVQIITDSLRSGNKLIVCGNGGSSSDSLHIVGELMKSFDIKRELNYKFKNKLKDILPDEFEYFCDNLQPTLEAISLVGEISFITAWINDANPDFLFAQQLLGYGKKNDVLLCLSTSGDSNNIKNAIKMAKVIEMPVILMTGSKFNKSKDVYDFIDVLVQSNSTDTFMVQEDHIKFYHLVCRTLEYEFFGH